jgi:uncharacterized protein YqgQ
MCDVLLPPGVNPTAVKYIYQLAGAFVWISKYEFCINFMKMEITKLIE